MTTTPIQSRRIVVVHGPTGPALAQILTHSGLEAIVDNGNISIWAPRPSPTRTFGDKEAS